jgi:MOSC domain-containing protein YiiM
VRLEVTGQTYPCSRIEEAHAGLLKALAVNWRGGVTCRVLSGGQVGLGDAVEVLVCPREVLPRLPG